jgi:hypothetical protein
MSIWYWWRIQGSNLLPPECKSGALPDELIPHTLLCITKHTKNTKRTMFLLLEAWTVFNGFGALTPTRTGNLLITNQLLYQLSYEGLNLQIVHDKLPYVYRLNVHRAAYTHGKRYQGVTVYRHILPCNICISVLFNTHK